MREWSKINKGSILNDRALLLEFTRDFTKNLGPLNIGCKQCIGEAYDRLIKFKPNDMEKVKECDYRLKAKYEGVFFEGNPIRNGDLTNKLAQRLLGKHPAGVSLFDRLAEGHEKFIGVVIDDSEGKDDKDLTFTQLKERYPTIKARSLKTFLIKVADLPKEKASDEEE